ncbi:cell wall hydrolase [Sphingosinicella sp. LHD-64]|uniref:cell wall hydrolase n=1 Tax=Sphingosinicella sp. LHD-64 TaxID=3072139 RepID=UPI00280D7357|nr:cell wall hydrolase [Sphingosinicella sp. LHD-64]MDQ8754714.1 cell wall hydrolase [Sphingosinicella sp. LHD-64]
MTTIAAELPDSRLSPSPRDWVRAHWRAALFVAAMLVLFAATATSLATRDPNVDALLELERAQSAPIAQLREAATETSATQLRPVAPQDALTINAAIPVSNLANPAARPFRMTGTPADRLRSLECLTAAIYYEAAREPTDGQRAVAQVVLNRVRHPAYPASVCGVVFEGARRYTGCQFSFTCDGSLRRGPMASYWEQARAVAEAALGGYVYTPVGWATHYHANYVVPYWASSLIKSATIGNHIFYRWRGGWGRPPAFLNRYIGAEPAIAWRGGFGQPDAAERLAAEGGERDAAAAAAAEEAADSAHSIDSFQRAVLRRYEAPLQRDSARQLISERAGTSGALTASQRWSLTGDEPASAPPQRPLGRWSTAPTEPQPITIAPPSPVQAPAQPSAGDATQAAPSR